MYVKYLACLVASFIFISGTSVAAHEWVAPEDAAEKENPITADQASVARGQEMFINNCASCHGDDARGMSADAAGLSKASPDLVKRLANHSAGDFFWKIKKGRGDMPSFGGILEEKEIWDIINFLKTR